MSDSVKVEETARRAARRKWLYGGCVAGILFFLIPPMRLCEGMFFFSLYNQMVSIAFLHALYLFFAWLFHSSIMSWLLAGCAIGCFVKFLWTASDRDWRSTDIGLGIVFLIQALSIVPIMILFIAMWFVPAPFPAPYIGFAVVVLWANIVLSLILLLVLAWCFLFRSSWAIWVLLAVVLHAFAGGSLKPEPNNPEYLKWRAEIPREGSVSPREVLLDDGQTVTVEVTQPSTVSLAPPVWANCLVYVAALVYALLRRRQMRHIGEGAQHCAAAGDCAEQ